MPLVRFQYGHQEEVMTNEEYEDHLRNLIRNQEERYIWYKGELEHLYKTGIIKQDPEWIKTLKELKNEEEGRLKRTREELTYYRQGLNPPFCYPFK